MPRWLNQRWLLNGFVVSLSLAGLSGCANRIIPPAFDPLKTAARIYLFDYGTGSSMVIPRQTERPESSAWDEYGFGEWKWTAESQTQWWRMPMMLFEPRQASLGKRSYESEKEFLAFVAVDEDHRAVAFTVELERLLEFQKDKEKLFQEQESIFNIDTLYVRHPEKYSAFRNCNHLTAEWLEGFGYKVKGTHLFSVWKKNEVKDR